MRRARREQRDESFEAAFDPLLARALTVARRVVGDPATAEDVAAEALARAYARWSAVEGMPHREAWVARVAANLAIDVVRRRRWTDPAVADRWDDPSVVDRLALVTALRGLPARQREVLVLRHVTDLSEADVAAALGVSAGTVKVHHHRAVAALRAQLHEGMGEVTLGIV